MIENMFRNVKAVAAVFAGCLLAIGLTGCGVSSMGPDGSKHQTMNGVGPSGYPAGKPLDSGSPALASSSEQAYSRPETEAK